MRKKNAGRKKDSGNRFFLLLTSMYTVVLFVVVIISCVISYHQKQSEALSRMDATFAKLEQEYTEVLDNFWQVYMPIVETGNSYVASQLTEYFQAAGQEDLTPFKKAALAAALKQMLIRDSDIQWVALYSKNRSYNYIMFQNSSSCQALDPAFPYLDDILAAPRSMSVWGMKPISQASDPIHTYAICGGVPAEMGDGRIIVGYSITAMEQIYKNSESPLNTLNYMITSGEDIVFHSNSNYEESSYMPQGNIQGVVSSAQTGKIYVNSRVRGNDSSVISYTVAWRELFGYYHSYTLQILLIALLFWGMTQLLYVVMIRRFTKEVDIIRFGLEEIGENHLQHKIPTNLKQGGLSEIAEAVNHMSSRLEENINRAYHYELRQKDAELAELQSKFNPHFLYNSLEMFSSRCYQSGDEETAELITQLAAIFRGFIGAQTFVPITEELTFSRRYLALFSARYGKQVKIKFDISNELLKYGTIRNIFQPLIENYFVHGFTGAYESNYILISGRSLDAEMMQFTVTDNGCGMSEEKIEQLNASLQEPIQISAESYGLKNLHQRLRLFYGSECGLTIQKNGAQGLCVKMKLVKMTMDVNKSRA